MNSGKGVIVDSGTTDTYLSSRLGAAFKATFKEMTGRTYTNTHWSLSEEAMLQLPTVVVQLRSKQSLNPDDAEGLVKNSGNGYEMGSQDDILVAMPPSHYMEYNANTKEYTPRLYFTESSGGVLGANFMQGHDVLFDWQENVLGFARSDCDYSSIPIDKVDENPNSDCEFLPDGDYVKEKCSALTVCENVDGSFKDISTGTELWGRVKRKDASGTGKTCPDVAAEEAATGVVFDNCNDSECFEARPCSCACQGGSLDNATLSYCNDKAAPAPDIDDTLGDLCEDLWGTCHVSEDEDVPCQQVKIESVYNAKDKNCYQVGSSTRSCNKGSCASVTSIVPYRMQVIITISKATWKVSNSNDFLEQFFENAMAIALGGAGAIGDWGGTSAGDIQIVMVDEWKNVDNADGEVLGTKVIVEVGIPNTEYNPEESWESVCSVQVSKVAEGAEEIKTKAKDLAFSNELFTQLKKFTAPSGSENIFENIEGVKVVESWTQLMDHCASGGNGGGGGGHSHLMTPRTEVDQRQLFSRFSSHFQPLGGSFGTKKRARGQKERATQFKSMRTTRITSRWLEIVTTKILFSLYNSA